MGKEEEKSSTENDTDVKVESNDDETVEDEKVEEEIKYIPRLLDAAGNVTPRSRDQNLEPAEWSVQNVTTFLEVNECSNRELMANFVQKEVDGVKFLTLTKQEIMTLV